METGSRTHVQKEPDRGGLVLLSAFLCLRQIPSKSLLVRKDQVQELACPESEYRTQTDASRVVGGDGGPETEMVRECVKESRTRTVRV